MLSAKNRRSPELMLLSMCNFGGCLLCAETACASLSECLSLRALLLTQDYKRGPTMSAGGHMGAIGAQDARQAKICKLADIAARVLLRRLHALDQHIGAFQITAQAKTLLNFPFKLTSQSRSLWDSESRSQTAAFSISTLAPFKALRGSGVRRTAKSHKASLQCVHCAHAEDASRSDCIGLPLMWLTCARCPKSAGTSCQRRCPSGSARSSPAATQAAQPCFLCTMHHFFAHICRWALTK